MPTTPGTSPARVTSPAGSSSSASTRSCPTRRHAFSPAASSARSRRWRQRRCARWVTPARSVAAASVEIRSEEHTSELQSRFDLVCRLLLEKKKKKTTEKPGQNNYHIKTQQEHY